MIIFEDKREGPSPDIIPEKNVSVPACDQVLFINLADQGGLGVKSTQALQKKYSSDLREILLINLLDAALAFKKNSSAEMPSLPGAPDKLPLKIMLAIHGLPGNTDHCYAQTAYENDAHEILFTPAQLAEFLSRTLEYHGISNDKNIKISLVMCYGARSSDFEKHLSLYTDDDFQSSFAFNFFRSFAQGRKGLETVMTARTGPVCFSDQTGRSEVQTLTAEEINRAELPVITEKYQQIAESYGQLEDPTPDDDREYEQVLNELTSLKEEILRQTRSKYGRIHYRSSVDGSILYGFKQISDPVEPARRMAAGQTLFSGKSSVTIKKLGENPPPPENSSVSCLLM